MIFDVDDIPDDQLLFRYEEVTYSRGVDEWDDPLPGYHLKVELRKYKILKRTPKGAWIEHPYHYSFNGKRKFVLLTARKKFACDTKENALVSYIARKKKQIKILNGKLKLAEECLQIAETMESGDSMPFGGLFNRGHQ